MTPETIDRIRSLEEKDGTLTAESVLNDAANPASPLHSHFQWDDSKAAHAYRIDQARTLIRSVRLVITTNEVAVRTVAYVRDPNKPAQEGGYINTFRLRKTPDDARRARMAEIERANNAMDRALAVARSLGLEAEINSIRASLAQIKEAA